MVNDWNLYRSFLIVARAGTLSAAAEQLGTSISTVHRQLGALEETLEARLFERRGRLRVLTGAGEALATRLERVEVEMLGIRRELAGADEAPRGTVLLTTTDTIADALLSRYLPNLRNQYPEVHLQVLVDNRHYRLGRGEADIALRPGAKPREPEVVARLIGEIAYSYYAANEYLDRHGRPRRKRDLLAHDVVVADESLAHVCYGRVAAEHTDPSRQVLRSPSLLVQATAVASGIGIAALPCFLMDRRPGIQRLFRPETEGPLWLLYHADLRHTARVRGVVDLLTAELTRDRALLSGEAD